MKKKLTVKEILNCKGKKKLTEVYVHNTVEAEACEKAGSDQRGRSWNEGLGSSLNTETHTCFGLCVQRRPSKGCKGAD